MIEAVELSPSAPRAESASSSSGKLSSASIVCSCGGGEGVLGLLPRCLGLLACLGALPCDLGLLSGMTATV